MMADPSYNTSDLFTCSFFVGDLWKAIPIDVSLWRIL